MGGKPDTIASSTIYKGEGGPRFTPNDLPKGPGTILSLFQDLKEDKYRKWQDIPKEELSTLARQAYKDEALRRLGVDVDELSVYPDGPTITDRYRKSLDAPATKDWLKSIEQEMERKLLNGNGGNVVKRQKDKA